MPTQDAPRPPRRRPPQSPRRDRAVRQRRAGQARAGETAAQPALPPGTEGAARLDAEDLCALKDGWRFME
jgi:hypothetical protein